MARRMLIDASAPGEVRVAVVDGSRLEDYDLETTSRKQLKGNVYLAQVTRVEPSLQAAFLSYKPLLPGTSGDSQRQGFLAFPEIHPDYFRIPVADRRLLDELSQGQDADDARAGADSASADFEAPAGQKPLDNTLSEVSLALQREAADGITQTAQLDRMVESIMPPPSQTPFPPEEPLYPAQAEMQPDGDNGDNDEDFTRGTDNNVETLSSDDFEEVEEARRLQRRMLRSYKIQEVIKRRQIMLVQVVKEERGSKGAALTSYISLPGRFCVLMPNSPHGGGVSRKINNHTDRRRMREILSQLSIPEGMSVILRTAGLERDIEDIRRDLDYLLRVWDQIRDMTMKSTAPALIYEEGDLIRRSLRDLYSENISEILVNGEAAYQTAREFMATLMPSHVDRIKFYNDPVPLFFRFDVEKQIDAIHETTIQLRSGGYIVINQTEALVAIDVNSGRSTKERNIEETALRTNLEAAEEVARQVRLRDLAGLVVVDFIDMEETRNRIAVERRLKDAMRHDRARIQIGRISAFGLLELSRQRLRPSLEETDFSKCVTCHGTGLVRSVESSARVALRALEDEALKRRSGDLTLFVPAPVALHVLNNLRASILNMEQRYGLSIWVQGDDKLVPPACRVERGEKRSVADQGAPVSYDTVPGLPSPAEGQPVLTYKVQDADDEMTPGRRSNRRRRGGNARRGAQHERFADAPPDHQPDVPPEAFVFADNMVSADTSEAGDNSEDNRRRRRGRRGGRKRFDNGASPDFSNNGQASDAEEAQSIIQPQGVVDFPSTAPRPPQQPVANDTEHEGSENQDGSAKRGWWQRLIEG